MKELSVYNLAVEIASHGQALERNAKRGDADLLIAGSERITELAEELLSRFGFPKSEDAPRSSRKSTCDSPVCVQVKCDKCDQLCCGYVAAGGRRTCVGCLDRGYSDAREAVREALSILHGVESRAPRKAAAG